MSFFGKNETTQSTSIPSYIEDAQKGLMGAAAGIATPFMQPSKYAVAGQNQDQLKAAELARQSAMGAFNTNYADKIMSAGGGYTPTTVTGESITEMMNPYLQNVGRDVMDNMRREKTAADAQIGARSASASAFGGSGPALERAQLYRNYNDQAGQMINTLLSGGYDRGASLAGANADRMNQAGQFNSQQGLNAAIAAAGASNNAFNNQQNSLQTLLGIGNQNQQYQQSVIDVPKNYASWLSGFIPGSVPQTTTTSSPNNPLSTILGLSTFL